MTTLQLSIPQSADYIDWNKDCTAALFTLAGKTFELPIFYLDDRSSTIRLTIGGRPKVLAQLQELLPR